MSKVDFSHLAFDRGIHSITHAREDLAWVLPERQDAPPAEGQAPTPLQALLAWPTLDDGLLAAVRPQVRQRDVLAPARFRQALDAALLHLETAVQAGPERPVPQQQALNRALRLLKEESGLRDLLQMYRNALYRG